MNFYKRHIGDYLKDTAHLSLLEHGVYSRLLDVYYTRESGIPDAQAARLIGARGKDETAALKVVLGEFFELVDGTWIQDRCERELHAAGSGSDDAEGSPAKSGKARRQQEYRERRAALFEALRERGITMPFKATMNELQDALLSVTKPSRVMPDVTDSVMGETHNVTATNIQNPDTTSHKPDIGSVVSTVHHMQQPDDFRPKDAAEWLSHFKRKHGFEADPTNVNDRKKLWPVFAAWSNAGLTAGFVDAAVTSAQQRAREPIACLPLYVDRLMASEQAARSNPQLNAKDESRRRAYEVLTGKTAPQSETPEVIHGHAKLLG